VVGMAIGKGSFVAFTYPGGKATFRGRCVSQPDYDFDPRGSVLVAVDASCAVLALTVSDLTDARDGIPPPAPTAPARP
jgi:hypothetical protein